MKERSGSRWLAVSWAALLALSSPVGAQEAVQGDRGAEDALDEIVVTATKREESAQKIAVAITAFSGDQLAARGVSNSQDLLNQVPSADVQANNGSSAANIYLRGIGTKGPGYNQVSAVGIYSDEVSLNSPIVNVLQLYDMDRVEILRGPQNTLYGRNTTGGAINFISKRPEPGAPTNGYLKGTLGRFDQTDLEAAVGFPVGDQFAVRLSGQMQKRDGVYQVPVIASDAYSRDVAAGRLQVRYQPADTVDMLLKLHVESVDNVNKLWKAIGLQSPVPVVVAGMNTFPTACAGPIALGSACVSANGRPTDPDDTTTFSSGLRNPIENVEAFGGSFTLNLDFDTFSLTAITAYEHNKFRKAEDVDATAQPTRTAPPFPVAPAAGFEGAFDFFQISKSNQWSQELRFASSDDSRLRWIAGAFAFGESTFGNTTALVYFNAMGNSTQLDQDLTVYSGYADFEYALTDRVSIIAGLRYTDEEIEGFNTTVIRSLNDAATAAALLPSNGQRPISTAQLLNLAAGMGRNVYVDAPFDESWGEWGGKLGFKFQVDPQMLVYGSVARGFKAGSFSPAPAQSINGSFFNPTDPEFLLAYELGFKNTWLDGTLRTNVSAYYYDYTDQQLLRVTDIPGLGLVAAQVNAGKSALYGLEVETQWAPGAGWDFTMNLGLLETDVKEFFDIQTCSPAGVGTCPTNGQRLIDYSGSELVNSPKVTASIGARKEWAVGSAAFLTAGVDVSYKGARWFDIPNDPVERDDSYVMLDAQLALRFGADERYNLTLWGKNLADKVYFVNKASFPSVGTVEALIGDPKTYGLSFTVKL